MADEQPNTPAVADPYDMDAKQQLHKKADAKNRIELRRGKPTLCCGGKRAESKGGGFCKSRAGAGTDHPGWGRCKYCGGASTGPKTEEGKEAASRNSRKHGFYSRVLGEEERQAYEEQVETESLGLQHEIYMLKAKILVYLGEWRKRWDRHYKRKLAEKFIRYKCQACGHVVVRGDLDQKPGYCPGAKCGEPKLKESERWVAGRSPEEAQEYADRLTKVYYSESEKGGRSYYHAGSIEDRALDRALNTLGRLVEKHARLTQESGDDLLSQVNKELAAASRGKVQISWGGKPQQRLAEKPEE